MTPAAIILNELKQELAALEAAYDEQPDYSLLLEIDWLTRKVEQYTEHPDASRDTAEASLQDAGYGPYGVM